MPSRAPLDLVYRRPATRDLDELFDYIALDRPLAAERLLLDIRRACEGLRWFPFIGRRLDPSDDRVRVLTVRGCVAVKFMVADGAVQIMRATYRGRNLTVFFGGSSQ